MQPLLCIVGPTAVGKTAKAIEIAKLIPSVLVSADSRQVYRSMDIVTGKDHPKDIPIIGVDIVDPNEPCSVSVWYDAVAPYISAADQAGKQVIVVGGTGLYIRALTEGIPTMRVPINQVLRSRLMACTLPQLQEEIKKSAPQKFMTMNASDRQNPRRLIRAIEIALDSSTPLPTNDPARPVNMIGLMPPDPDTYRQDVVMRVRARLEHGAIAETEKIKKTYGDTLQSLSAIGYRSILAYLKGDLSREELVAAWVADELAYAKRQMTWFRKVPQIKWYDKEVSGRTIYADTKN